MREGPYTAAYVYDLVQHSPSYDYQAHLVYNAESEVMYGEKMTITQVREYIDEVTSTRWWHNRTPKKVWTVKLDPVGMYGDGYCYADYENSTIALPRWGRNKLTILHELSHMFIEGKRSKTPWHGPQFAWFFSHISKRFDPELHAKLMKSFQDYEVELKKPRTVLRLWR